MLRRNGRAEAQRGYNDDLIMACAIGCWVRDTALIENQRDLEYKKAMIGSIMSSKTHIDSRIPGMTKPRHVELFEKAVEQRNTNKEFIWLLKG